MDYIIDKKKNTQIVVQEGLFMENKDTIAMSFNVQWQIPKRHFSNSDIDNGSMVKKTLIAS